MGLCDHRCLLPGGGQISVGCTVRNAILYGVVCVEMGMITKRIGGRGRGLVQVQVQVQVAHAICPYTKRSYCPLYERVRVILINQSFDDVSDVLPRQAFFNVLYVRVRNCRSTVLRYSAGTHEYL